MKKVIVVTGKEHNNPIFEILKKEKNLYFNQIALLKILTLCLTQKI